MADLNRAIALDPKLAHAFFNRGTVYLQKENYDLAIADYTAAMRHGSKDILTFAVRGGAWRDKGDYKRAKADFEAALALPAEDKRSKAVQEAVRELLRALQERAERERVEREEREQAERERIETERRARAEREAIEREQAERAKAEQVAQQRAEQAARERAKLEKAARERAEWEKAAREKAEREKAARERAKLENAAREQAERERVERERAEHEKAARERAEQTARDRAEKVARDNEKREALERAKEQRRKAEREKARANRIALVIGNSVYQTLDALDNPRNDANDVADMLDQLNFTVFRGIDLTYAETADMRARFKEAARRAEIALFYFGGHGIQDGGVNYLAPVDANIGDLGSFLALQSVMHDLKSESGARVLMIDACRTSLATQEVASPQVPAPRFVLLKRGLAPPEIPSGAEGRMFVVFATEPGEVASDGVGRNSPFARGLLKHLASPGLELRLLFVRVRSEVLRETGGVQNPHVDDRLKGEFVFKAGR